MSSLDKLIRFDRQGELGPSLSLIACANTYTPKQLTVVIQILQENAERIAHRSLRGRKEFIRSVQTANPPMTAVQIIGTRFFQGLQASEPLPPTYPRIKQFIVPNTLAMTSNFIPQFKELLEQHKTKEALTEWVAKVLSAYLTEEQVYHECRYQEFVKERPEIRTKRMECGQIIYAAAQEKKLSKQGFDAVMWGLKHRTEYETCMSLADWYCEIERQAGSQEAYQKIILHIENYLALFSLAGRDADWFGPHICDMLEKIFGEKFFPKEEAPLFLPTGLLGPAGMFLSLFHQANSLSSAQLTQAAKKLKRTYTVMTGKEIYGRKLFCQMFEVARQEGREVSWKDMLSSQMFTAMQPGAVNLGLHELTERYLVPYSLYKVSRHTQDLVREEHFHDHQFRNALAGMIESFMSSEDLRCEGRSIKVLGMVENEFYHQRVQLESMLYQAAWEGRLGESDLDLIIRSLQGDGDAADNLGALLQANASMAQDKKTFLAEVVAQYKALYSIPLFFGLRARTARLLNIYFRETFFPGSPVIS